MIIRNRLVITPANLVSGMGTTANSYYDLDIPESLSTRKARVKLATFTRRDPSSTIKSLIQNKLELAKNIDLIWKNNDLFANLDQPDSFYKDYTDELIKTLRLNISLFGHLGMNPNFIYEFETFKNRKDTSELEKAIFLTQAFELALFNSDPSKILNNLNSKSKSEGKGHKNELMAAWFLAKFIYDLPVSSENPFLLSINLKSYERDKETNKTFDSIKEREVDILTSDSIVSVKSMNDSYSKQIRNMFFLIADDINPGLKDRVQKIILVKSSDSSDKKRDVKQSSLKFKTTKEYRKLIEHEVYSAKGKIEKYKLPSGCKRNEYERFTRKFLTPENIEIYFLPAIDKDFPINLSNWINDKYTEKREAA